MWWLYIKYEWWFVIPLVTHKNSIWKNKIHLHFGLICYIGMPRLLVCFKCIPLPFLFSFVSAVIEIQKSAQKHLKYYFVLWVLCIFQLFLSGVLKISRKKLCFLWGSCRSFIETIKWCLKYVSFLSFPPKTSSYMRCNSVSICCKLMLVWLLLCNTSALKIESIKSIQHEIKIKDKFMICLWNQHIKITTVLFI